MKIIAFGASASKNSINKTFAAYTAHQFNQAEVEILDLNDYPLPLFTTDIEQAEGIPAPVHPFLGKLQSADLIIISLAEHNGTYTTAFKNIFDWTSRLQLKMFEHKAMLLLSTAPGPRGGLGVMEAARTRFPIHGATLLGTFSLPKFKENFDEQLGITDPELNENYRLVLEGVKQALQNAQQ